MPAAYREAKDCEVRGEFEKAIRLLQQVIDTVDQPLTAVKDKAGLLHRLKRTQEALDFLTLNEPLLDSPGVTNEQRRKYVHLQHELNTALENERKNNLLPRCIFAEVMVGDPKTHQFPDIFAINTQTAPRLFNNYTAVVNIFPAFGAPWKSNRVIIEFATNSAARRALGGLLTHVCNVRATWAPLEVQFAEPASEETKDGKLWEAFFAGEKIPGPEVKRLYPAPEKEVQQTPPRLENILQALVPELVTTSEEADSWHPQLDDSTSFEYISTPSSIASRPVW